jgi:hypothetical protein
MDNATGIALLALIAVGVWLWLRRGRGGATRNAVQGGRGRIA